MCCTHTSHCNPCQSPVYINQGCAHICNHNWACNPCTAGVCNNAPTFDGNLMNLPLAGDDAAFIDTLLSEQPHPNGFFAEQAPPFVNQPAADVLEEQVMDQSLVQGEMELMAPMFPNPVFADAMFTDMIPDASMFTNVPAADDFVAEPMATDESTDDTAYADDVSVYQVESRADSVINAPAAPMHDGWTPRTEAALLAEIQGMPLIKEEDGSADAENELEAMIEDWDQQIEGGMLDGFQSFSPGCFETEYIVRAV